MLPAGVTPEQARIALAGLRGELRKLAAPRLEAVRRGLGATWGIAARGEWRDWEQEITNASVATKSWFARILANMARRSARKGSSDALGSEHLLHICRRSAGYCEVTGLKFSFAVYGNSRMRPFAPSLDRIVAGGPYSIENCRLVCAAVNVAMFNWGEALFRTLAVGYVSRILKQL